MINRRLVAFGTLLAVGLISAGPAAAELTPWEKFCLKTSKPGKDIANCLDGLPSGGGQNKVAAPRGSSRPGVLVKTRNHNGPRIDHSEFRVIKLLDAN
jgi:hypothetical protein